MSFSHKDIALSLLLSFGVFGGIYLYYAPDFSADDQYAGEQILPPITFHSSSSIQRRAALPLAERSELYHNARFGYSVLYPKYLVGSRCDVQPYATEGYPVTVLEDGDSSIITPTILTHDQQAENSSETTCAKEDVTLDTIKKEMQDPLFYYWGWKMVGQKNISNDAELLAFIRQWYGTGCEILAKNETDQRGVYDVEIKGDEGDDNVGSLCPLNFIYALKYSPTQKIAVTWKIGQDGRFDDLDNEMIRSFRFEE